ncbi:MAG: trypsin-like peptidase domain-containing protein [Planctomycetales bacterium]|nr:trypsin-like peptidase domain-containing protein [Planctomycetales bacterium]
MQFKDGSKGIGSGFVVDAERRWVVTNYHVVADSQAASVVFANRERVEVEGWRAHYTERDLALLQIKSTKPLVALPLATELPRKGERTVAIGTPQGLSFTATEGIVSAIRTGDEVQQFMPKIPPDPKLKRYKMVGTWLQTSTPISSGSSGGPLLNLKGEVVGVNSGTLSSGQNLNFAVSLTEIRQLVDVGKRIRLRELSLLAPSLESVLAQSSPTGASRPANKPGNGDGGKVEKVVISVPAQRRFRHQFKVVKQEDEFDKLTVLETQWLPVVHNNPSLTSLGLRVRIVFDDEAVLPLAIWEIGATARTFQFLGPDATRFQVLGGDDSYELPNSRGESKIVKGGTSEIVKGVMGLDVFAKVVLSNRIKSRVGKTEIAMDDRHLECLRDLASQIPLGKFFEDRLEIIRLPLESDPTVKKR